VAYGAQPAPRRRESREHAPTLGRAGGPPLGLSTGGLDTPLVPRGLLDHRGSEGQSEEEEEVEELEPVDDEDVEDVELDELVAGVEDEEDEDEERLSVR
jgi:hypothetical protein